MFSRVHYYKRDFFSILVKKTKGQKDKRTFFLKIAFYLLSEKFYTFASDKKN